MYSVLYKNKTHELRIFKMSEIDDIRTKSTLFGLVKTSFHSKGKFIFSIKHRYDGFFRSDHIILYINDCQHIKENKTRTINKFMEEVVEFAKTLEKIV